LARQLKARPQHLRQSLPRSQQSRH